MSEQMSDYFDALERLKKKNAKINNDTVAIEAGRKKGSIKKSRLQFNALIAAIETAASEMANVRAVPEVQLEIVKADRRNLRQLLDESLSREVALHWQVFSLQNEIRMLTQGVVLPIISIKR